MPWTCKNCGFGSDNDKPPDAHKGAVASMPGPGNKGVQCRRCGAIFKE